MIRLGTPLDIPLRMHPALPVLAVCALLLGHGLTLAAAMGALALHEAGHALAARALGLEIDEIELTPFGGVARMREADALPPAKEAALALAGPAASFLGMLLILAFGWQGNLSIRLFRANLAIGAFNLLPVLPLDGGRAICALLPRRAARLFAYAGMALGGLVVLLGVYASLFGVVNPLLFLSGAYLIRAAAQSRDTRAAAAVHALQDRADRLRKRGYLPVSLLAVQQETPPERLTARLTAQRYYLFCEVDSALRVTRAFDEGAVLEKALKTSVSPPDTP